MELLHKLRSLHPELVNRVSYKPSSQANLLQYPIQRVLIYSQIQKEICRVYRR
jgi:hypothetical protein